MIAIPNMEKPKSCYLCTFRIINPMDGSICGCVIGHIQGIPLDQDRATDCPLIEIDDEIWEALKPKVETMSLAERGWITDEERRTDEHNTERD